MPRWTPAVVLALMLYPLAAHFMVIGGQPTLPIIFSALMLVLVLWLARATWLIWTLLLIAATFAAVARPDPADAVFLPPVLVNAALLVLFGRSLLPDRQPLITRLAGLYRGRLEPRVEAYTRGVTWAWTALFGALLIEVIVLALFAPLEIWSLFAHAINYALIGAFFIIEYAVRRRHLADLPHPGFWKFVAFLRATNWHTFFRGHA